MNAADAIQARLDRADLMNTWGRLPRNERRVKKMPPLYQPPVYPEGVMIATPYAVSWGEIEAVAWGESSPILKFKHEIVLGKHESHNPWGLPQSWLEVPDRLWFQVVKRVGDQWFPKMGSAGSLTAIVWCQVHGSIGDHPDHWVAHDIAQVELTPDDYRKEIARKELFDRLWQYREGGVSIEYRISEPCEGLEGESVEFYVTSHARNELDAFRRVSEAHPGALISMPVPTAAIDDEF